MDAKQKPEAETPEAPELTPFQRQLIEALKDIARGIDAVSVEVGGLDLRVRETHNHY
jgi:hypothetical protein